MTVDIVEEMRGYEIDHTPDGWPAVTTEKGNDVGITGGFGTTMDLERGTMRQWVMGRDCVKRWADNGEPVQKMATTLPNDVARCAGVGDDDEGWREGCDDCARRLAESTRAVSAWILPPAIIVFECEFRIETPNA